MWTLDSEVIHSIIKTKIGIQTRICFDCDDFVHWDEIEPMMIEYGVCWDHNRELTWMRRIWSVLEQDGLTRYDSCHSWIAVMWHAYAICHIYHTFNRMYYQIHEDVGNLNPNVMFPAVDPVLYRDVRNENLHRDKRSYHFFQSSLQTVCISLMNHYICDPNSDDAVVSIFESLASIRYDDCSLDVRDDDLTLFELELYLDHPDLFEQMSEDKLGRVFLWIKEGFWTL